MKTSSLPNVRLVRCPRCRELLPEPSDVPFYKCGGCDTILQAKLYNKPNQTTNSQPNHQVEYGAQGGDPNTSKSIQASSSSESYHRPLSSSAQHALEPNQDTEQNCEVTNTLSEDSLLNDSSSPTHHLPSSLAPERGAIQGQVEHRRDSIASSSQESVENGQVRLDSPAEAASSEATTVRIDGQADELNPNAITDCRLEQPGATPSQSQALLSDESCHHETSTSSHVAVEQGQLEGSSSRVKEQCDVSDSSSEPILSNEPTVGGDLLSSQPGSPNEEMMTTAQRFVSNPRERPPIYEVNREQEVLSTNEPVSSSQFPTANEEGEGDDVGGIYGRDAHVYSNAEASSTESTSHENKYLSQLVTESQNMDGGSIQNGLAVSNEAALVLPEAEETSDSILQSKYADAVDSPVDESSSVPALKPTKEAEVLSVVDRSQKTMETNLTENVKEETATKNAEVIDATFEVGTSYRYLPKCPTRSSAYDGSVSSYDGNDDQVKTETFAAEDLRPHRSGRNTRSSGPTFRRKSDNVEAMREEGAPPPMLTEIKMPESLSDAPYRRKGTRPWSQEFPPRGPMYRRSPERRRRYGSSGHLVHKEYYDLPTYQLPYQYNYKYRDVESRYTRQSDVDGRMISEAVWMGEELHRYPYPESSSEIYPYPRQQMHYHATRQSEYQPPVHSIARVPYAIRSGGYMRWPSHLGPSGVSYGRGLYSGSTELFDSYGAASPQVFSESEYYSEDQRQRTRRNSQCVQHFQPIGGAAPFITCYRCLELLQLPSDFLAFKGIKIHRVKCNACSEILKFTLERGCHLVRHVPKQPVAAGADKLVKSASASHDDYGIDIDGGVHRRSASAQVSLGSSPQALGRPRSHRHFQDKGKSAMPMEEEMQRRNSSSLNPPKVTWKLPNRRSTSPLHRLMGYSSPSDVLFGGPGGGGYASSDELELEH